MKLAVAGAGAFGTGLAVALCANGPVLLWARDANHVAEMQTRRENTRRLPGIRLPETLSLSSDAARLTGAEVILLAIPAQKLRQWLQDNATALQGKHLVACCKGIDLETLKGAGTQLAETPGIASASVLTGPSFAIDLARGLPTALTLACPNAENGAYLQSVLSTPAMRLYRSEDLRGAELGGALKNVIAIACGVAIGAGFGESARAAVITRGYAEMTRLAVALGADPNTLAGLSGFGDLALTCTSEKSRNYRLGLSIGKGEPQDKSMTVEGAATAIAAARLARQHDLDLPITDVVVGLVSGELAPESALAQLLTRPLKEE